MVIGKRIAALRRRHDLSQKELATRLNISKSSLAMYETGQREPNNETEKRIADFFDVSRSYLLGDTDDPDETAYSADDEKSAIINKIARDFPNADLMFHDMANMDTEQLQEVYEFIKFKMSQNKGD